MNAAAIDLGTNSVKILIVRRDNEGHMHVLFRHRSVVRLGEGTFAKGHKDNKIPRYVQVRTLKALQNYAKFLEAYKVDTVRATGTSALREAKNGPEFVKEVRAKTGIALEILPGEEEARLIVKGVASELHVPRQPVLFVDIGGGSCEISLLEKRKIHKFASIPLGAVRLTDLYLPDSKPEPSQLRRLDQHIRKVLKDCWPTPSKTALAFGSAGTIRALARLINKTELTNDERLITRKQLERAAVLVSKMSRKRITALPGIDSKRAEILVAGSRTLKEVFDYFGIQQLKVSNRGLREGLLIDLFEKPQKPSKTGADAVEQERMEFLNAIGRRYRSNQAHCHQVWNLARSLFDELAPVHGLSAKLKPILMTASVLHDVGHFINEGSNHKHSFYILKNTPIPFLSEREHLMMATLARYHRKSPPKESHEGYADLDPQEKKELDGLAAILRLADALDAPHSEGVKWLKCQWGPGNVRIGVELKEGATLDQETIRDKAKLFESLYKVTVSVVPVSELKITRLQSIVHPPRVS